MCDSYFDEGEDRYVERRCHDPNCSTSWTYNPSTNGDGGDDD